MIHHTVISFFFLLTEKKSSPKKKRKKRKKEEKEFILSIRKDSKCEIDMIRFKMHACSGVLTANDDTLTKVTSDTPHGHLVLFSSQSTEEIHSEN
jgi:hypothetical protein